MVKFLQFISPFIKALKAVPRETWTTLGKIVFHPHEFFGQKEWKWGWGYLTSGLALAASLLWYVTPTSTIEDECFGQATAEHLTGNLMSQVSQVLVLFLSVSWIILMLSSYLLFRWRSRLQSFSSHCKACLYTLSTVYFLVSFVLIVDATVAFKLGSILETSKNTLQEGFEMELVISPECQKETIHLFGIQNKEADVGVRIGCQVLERLSIFQRVLVNVLMAFTLIYPIFLLWIFHFKRN